VYRIFCGSADFVITDADGNIVQDTKRDRIAREARLAELLARQWFAFRGDEGAA
jgi:hypothetical protein